MDTLSNVSQLRNLWLRSADERLASWREFRLELQDSYDSCDSTSLLSSLDAISVWWSYMPLVTVSMDPFSPSRWPTVWEIIADGQCCKYSKGLAMALNAYYLDSDLDVRVARVLDRKAGDEYLVAIVNDEIVLNTPYGNTANLRDVSHIETQESWQMDDILRLQEH